MLSSPPDFPISWSHCFASCDNMSSIHGDTWELKGRRLCSNTMWTCIFPCLSSKTWLRGDADIRCDNAPQLLVKSTQGKEAFITHVKHSLLHCADISFCSRVNTEILAGIQFRSAVIRMCSSCETPYFNTAVALAPLWPSALWRRTCRLAEIWGSASSLTYSLTWCH